MTILEQLEAITPVRYVVESDGFPDTHNYYFITQELTPAQVHAVNEVVRVLDMDTVTFDMGSILYLLPPWQYTDPATGLVWNIEQAVGVHVNAEAAKLVKRLDYGKVRGFKLQEFATTFLEATRGAKLQALLDVITK